MGKSVWKDLFREIKRTFGRFIAIFAIVAIGVAFFAGVTASSNDMKNSTDHYYDDYNMSDLRLLSSIGFNEDDINAIREVQGVKGMYPAYSQDAVIRKDSIETAVHIMSVPVNTDRDNKDYINQLRIKEGRLPEKNGECVVRYEESRDNFSIGDTIKLSSGTQDDINDSLKDRELLIETKDGISMIFGKPNDVVTFLEHGIVDIGFVGKDTLDDVDFEDYYELLDLEIGKCYFAVAAYPEYRNKVFNRRKKIASKYTNVAKKYFASKQEDVEIIKLEGSVELGPVTGISDAIVDIVETGSTLKANGLEVIEKVSDISTRMIVNKVAFKFKKDEIMNIVNQLEKVIGGN